ncbi:MAG: DUF6491 family protein [Erythrobacter sp.]
MRGLAVLAAGLVLAAPLAMPMGGGAEALASGGAEDADEPTAREQGGRQCFRAREVNGFRTVEDENGRRSEMKVLIDVRAADTFELTFQQRCPEIGWARSVGFSQTGVGRVCDGLDVDLIVPDPNLGDVRCPVVSVRKLAPGEEGARAGATE